MFIRAFSIYRAGPDSSISKVGTPAFMALKSGLEKPNFLSRMLAQTYRAIKLAAIFLGERAASSAFKFISPSLQLKEAK